MNKIILDEQKKVCLDILRYVDSVCKDNNINYSLCGGTLLGAVRHEGFIPWDDDIDICLVRDEYDKLLDILNSKEKYQLYQTLNDSSYSYGFAKLADKNTILHSNGLFEPDNKKMGVFIDIFPIDGIPEDLTSEKKHRQNVENLAYYCNKSVPVYYAADKNHIKALVKLFLHYPKYRKLNKIGNNTYWKNLLINTMRKYKTKNSQYSGFLLSIYNFKEKFPSSIFNDYTRLNFEGYEFQCIKNYKIYLEALYGDYMKLPSIENRITNHEYKAYWKD